MQPKKQDDLKQHRHLKDAIRHEQNSGSEEASTPGEGLSGEGADSVLPHLRDFEQKRFENPDWRPAAKPLLLRFRAQE